MLNRKFISRNYKHLDNGGGIAKSDIDITLENLGYQNIGLRRSFYHNNLVHGIRNFIGLQKAMMSIHRNDAIVLQYPMKIGFDRICKKAHQRGAKIICLIHDLSSFRNKSLTPHEEIMRLNATDVLLTHNHMMRQWLSEHGCKVKMIDYEIMDYLHGESGEPHEPVAGNYSLFYVGNVSFKTHPYLRKLAEIMPDRDIYIYGHHPDTEEISKYNNLHYMGIVSDRQIIKSHMGDFGLSWYGESLDDGVGRIGEYMSYNNPHKISLDLRCNAPVIVWSKAGRAEFIEKEHLGLTVNSLATLDEKLKKIDYKEYRHLTDNVRNINAKLKSGFYLDQALRQAIDYLSVSST